MQANRKHALRALECHLSQRSSNRMPDAGGFFLSLFLDLSRGRSYGSFGPNPIQWSELEAWMRVRRSPLRQSDIDILLEMDAVFLEYAYKAPDNAPRPQITAEGLDAAFAAAGW